MYVARKRESAKTLVVGWVETLISVGALKPSPANRPTPHPACPPTARLASSPPRAPHAGVARHALDIRRPHPARFHFDGGRHVAPRHERAEDVAHAARRAAGEIVGAARNTRRLQSRHVSRANVPHTEEVPPAVQVADLQRRRLPTGLDARDLAREACPHETRRLDGRPRG
jgi:hypothetical protein